MIVYATKLSAKKIAAGILVIGAVVLGVTVLAPKAEQTASVGVTETANMDATLKTNEDRIALLEGHGWSVNSEAVGEREVQIPKEFDETYDSYNAIQQEQGLDLVPYQGKRATLYTYEILDYPNGEVGVTANLLIRKNKLIAADISSAQSDGFVHGITQMPETPQE